MKNLARRAFLKFSGGAALAAPMIGPALGNAAMERSKAQALDSALSSFPVPSQPATYQAPPELIALQELSGKRQALAQRLIAYRDGCFDPDIACLKSVSHATRTRMQIAKDESFIAENQSLWKKIDEWQTKLSPALGIGNVAQAARRILG